MFNLSDLLEAVTGIRPEQTSLVIPEAAIDSRQVIPGSLFIALPGEHVDGHDYIEVAFECGASLALIQRDPKAGLPVLDLSNAKLPDPLVIPDAPFCIKVRDGLKTLQETARIVRSRSGVKVIGITGSVGKSTTKEVVTEVLAQRYHTSRRKIMDALRRLGVSIRNQGIRRGGSSEIGRCKRCDILLPEAPEGTDALCGWCVAEKAGAALPSRLPSLNSEAEPVAIGLLQAVFVSGVG